MISTAALVYVANGVYERASTCHISLHRAKGTDELHRLNHWNNPVNVPPFVAERKRYHS
jgi:hypothetical protein